MLRPAAYGYMYGPLAIALLLFVAGLVAWKSATFRRSWKYRSLLYVFITVC